MPRLSKPLLLAAVALAVVIIAAFGYHQSKRILALEASAARDAQASASPAPGAIPSPTSYHYLDVKEFGVKIKLPDNLKDVTYQYSNADGHEVVGISTESLAFVSGGTCNAKSAALGSISRSKRPNIGGTTLHVDDQHVFKIGDYYVYYMTPQGDCHPGYISDDVDGLVQGQQGSFASAFETLRSDND